MQILVIDDDVDFRELVGAYLRKEFPHCEVTQYDPGVRGRPDADFAWMRFDMVLLDYELGLEDSGLDWLRSYKKIPGFPAIILLTGVADAYVAARAVKFGADDYLNKRDLSAQRLAATITSALSQRAATEAADAPGSPSTRSADSESIATQPNAWRGSAHSMPSRDGIKGYELVSEIGRGASATLYLAERHQDGLSVVIKVLNADPLREAELAQRFVREGELVAGLSCPQVVRVYAQGYCGDHAYIAMEFLPRGDLKQRIVQGLGWEEALRHFYDIARGLEAIHELDIVHRDLKPGNIMFRYDDSLALADFGISKRMSANSDLTTMGQIIGTPHYMSPEQGQGNVVDARSDLYSAGIIFFEMLTGHRPYTADTVTGMIYKHAFAEIPKLPSELRAYQPIVDGLLAKEPGERIASPKQLIAMLDQLETSD